MDNAVIIRDAIERVFALRDLARSNQELATALAAIKRMQARRFSSCYADLIASKEYGPAARFFLDELYGDGDFSNRDAQFARITGTLTTVFPASVVSTAVALAQLHALTEELDHQMACQWAVCASAASDTARFSAAWRAVGRPSDRKRQLEIVLLIGQRLAKLTRKPGLGTLLKLMRRPAATAGLESLQHFLEQGFAIFAALARSEKTVVEFLETISARETSWIDMMFDPSSSY